MSDDFAAKLENPICFDAVYLFCSDQEEYEIRKILENISREEWISKYRRQEFLEWLKTEKKRLCVAFEPFGTIENRPLP